MTTNTRQALLIVILIGVITYLAYAIGGNSIPSAAIGILIGVIFVKWMIAPLFKNQDKHQESQKGS